MKKMKKTLVLLLALTMVLSLVACGGSDDDAEETVDTEDTGETVDTEDTGDTEDAGDTGDTTDERTIAVLLYDGTDTYIGTVRNALQDIDAEDDTIAFEFHDGKADTATQTDQLNNVISQDVDALLININDVTAADNYLQLVRDSEIPALFFNRDMTASIEDASEVIFVGTDAPEAGVMQGEMFAEYYEANPDTVDRNGDGKISYTVLHGGLDNPEAQARTEYAIKTSEEAGIEMDELGTEVCNWASDKAKTATDAWIQKYPDDLDVIFANNDMMALGAIEALNQAGYNTEDGDFIPVYGVDAIAEAMAAVDAGTLAGTVKQDNVGMAEACTALIKNRIDGNDWLEGTDYEMFEDGKSVRIPYQKVATE